MQANSRGDVTYRFVVTIGAKLQASKVDLLTVFMPCIYSIYLATLIFSTFYIYCA